jgi:acyl-CoA reductase-like NAD-dependent aldehyde dehydrogenase
MCVRRYPLGLNLSATLYYRVEVASESDVKQTVAGAQSIFQAGTWSRAPAIERSKALSRLARALEERIPEFAEIESLQTGRAIREMKAQLTRLPEWMSALSDPSTPMNKHVFPFQ